jgi:hypothetical protein
MLRGVMMQDITKHAPLSYGSIICSLTAGDGRCEITMLLQHILHNPADLSSCSKPYISNWMVYALLPSGVVLGPG